MRAENGDAAMVLLEAGADPRNSFGHDRRHPRQTRRFESHAGQRCRCASPYQECKHVAIGFYEDLFFRGTKFETNYCPNEAICLMCHRQG